MLFFLAYLKETGIKEYFPYVTEKLSGMGHLTCNIREVKKKKIIYLRLDSIISDGEFLLFFQSFIETKKVIILL